MARFWSLDELLVIVAGEIKSTVCAVFKLIEQHVRKLLREPQVFSQEISLQNFDQRFQQEGVIIKIRIQVRLAAFVGGEQSLRFRVPHGVAHKCERASRRRQPVRPPKYSRGMRHALDHQRVPTGEDFFVATRADACLTLTEQRCLCGRQQRLALRNGPGERFRHVREGPCHRQIPEMHFKIGRLIKPVVERDHAILVRRQQSLDLMQRPDVKLALMPFRVSVQRGKIPI